MRLADVYVLCMYVLCMIHSITVLELDSFSVYTR